MCQYSDTSDKISKIIEVYGLSSVYRRQGLKQETVDTAPRAVSLLHPKMVNAHRYLIMLRRNNGGDIKKAAFHRQEAKKIIRTRPRANTAATTRNEKLFPLPEIPRREERLKILLERPDPKPPREDSGKTFVLVSGLPRSGTSLMLQLLAAGGVPPMTDNERVADADNPRGYFEWEAIKQIAKQPELLDDPAVEGKAIKCISMLLPKMPAYHHYKVIFITCPIEKWLHRRKK